MMGKISNSKSSKGCEDVGPIKKNIVKVKNFIKKDEIEDNISNENSVASEIQEAATSVKEKPNSKLSSDKKFPCQICLNTFSSHKKLIQHFVEHGKIRKKYDKPTQCDTCSMIFPTPTNAIQHKHRAHPNIPNSFCQFCGKLFVLKNSLNEHLAKDHPNQLSESSSSIKCDHCSATFLNTNALEYHVKSMHKQINYLLASDLYIPPSSTKIIRSNSSELFSAYYCHLCGVEYMIKNGLKKHLYEMHSPEERNTTPGDCIKCKTCEAIFFTKFAYQKHLTFHKLGDLYAANQEERMKVVSRVDQDFDIGRVPLMKELNSMLKQMAENNMLSHAAPSGQNAQANRITTKTINQANNQFQPLKQLIKIEIPKENDTLTNPMEIDKKIFEPIAKIENKTERNNDIVCQNVQKELIVKGIDIQKKTQKNEFITIDLETVEEKNEPPLKKISLEKQKQCETIDLCNGPIISKVDSLNQQSTSMNTTLNFAKHNNSMQKATENKIVKKSKNNATLEIVDSQNKIIVLKKVVLKKKSKVKVKNKEVTS